MNHETQWAITLVRSAYLGAFLAGSCGYANATDLPAVNLGVTSFYDGAPIPGGPGWTMMANETHYEGRKITNKNGDTIGLPKSTTNFDTTVIQLAYQGSGGPWGGNWGFAATLPIITKARVNDGLNGAVLDAQEGVGDLNFGPYLQFDPIMGKNGPIFAQRFELDLVAPTGKYDKDSAINPGSNFWSFNPYWAGTLWTAPKWSTSWRLHYLYNFKNSAPSPETYGTDASDMQAGQAVHLNFASNYAIAPQLDVGISGYWLKQFTDTQVNGHDVEGRREKVFAIGPSAAFSFSKDNIIIANFYFESDSENRPEGNRLNFRWIHKL